jgi:hypothetical protein
MSEWIRTRAAEIRLAEKLKKEERERQIEAANVLKAKMEPFWNDLLSVLQSSVEEFNREFPEAERAIDKVEKPSPSNLTIRRSVYPAAFVKVQLGNGSTSLKYSISRTQRKGTDPVETDGSLTLGLTEGQPSYIAEGVSQHEDVAKLCLEPFFQF